MAAAGPETDFVNRLNTEQNRQIEGRFNLLETVAEGMGINLRGLDSWNEFRSNYASRRSIQDILQMPVLDGLVNNINLTRQDYQRLDRFLEPFGIPLLGPGAIHARRRTQNRAQLTAPAWIQCMRNSGLSKFITDHYKYWRIVMLVMTFYSGIMAPIEFAFFKRYSSKSFLALDLLVMVVFILDLFVQTIRIIIKCEPKKKFFSIGSVFLHILDALASGPWALLYKKREGLAYRIFTILRLLQIRRFFKAFGMIEKVENRERFTFFKMIQFGIMLFFSAHIAGCIFYFIPISLPEREQDKTWFKTLHDYYPNFLDESAFTRYTFSVYFSFTTITTVGYGDIHPVHILERIFNIFFKVLGLFILAYINNEFGRLIERYLPRPPILTENQAVVEPPQNGAAAGTLQNDNT